MKTHKNTSKLNTGIIAKYIVTGTSVILNEIALSNGYAFLQGTNYISFITECNFRFKEAI